MNPSTDPLFKECARPHIQGFLNAADLPSSGLPLGGIGTGGIELWADGVFRAPNFTNVGQLTHGYNFMEKRGVSDAAPYSVEDQFFLLRVKTPSKGVQMRFLFVGHGTAFNSWGHMPRTYKYARIPTIQAIRHEEAFPFIRLRYVDDKLPVEVSLEAWTPFVPHDLAASSLPGAWFDFTVINTGDEVAEVSILHTATNIAGWDQDIIEQIHSVTPHRDGVTVTMRGGQEGHPTTGNLSLTAIAKSDQHVTVAESHPWFENIIWPFMKDGDVDGPLHLERLSKVEYFARNASQRLKETQLHCNEAMHRNRAWTCIRSNLAPGTKSSYSFGLTWYFPNHYDRHDRFAGKNYATRFEDSHAVAEYMIAHRDAHFSRSSLWPSLLDGSTLEPAFAYSLMDQLGSLVKSTWLTEKGEFFIWEGLGHASVNTVDVEHYGSFALALWFPELRIKTLRQALEGQRADGHIAHGYTLERRDLPEAEYHRWDVDAQFVLAVYREWKWTGDTAFLHELYPGVVRALRHLMSRNIPGIGLPWTEGGITYDHWHLKGIVTYVVGVYLAALKATIAMAEALGESVDVGEFSQDWKSGQAMADALLWNPERNFYRVVCRELPFGYKIEQADTSSSGDPEAEDIFAQFYGVSGDTERLSIDDGLHTDALNGDVFARLVGLQTAFNPDHAKAMTALIAKLNRNHDARFLANGTCPDDGYPDEWPLTQWHNPWTGIEYFFAAQLFQQDMVAEGLSVIRDVFERLSGQGVRFNHPECGNHYSRALSIYASYLAYTGIQHDAVQQNLKIMPADPCAQQRLPVLTASLLGSLEIDKTEWRLRILGGETTLQSITLPHRIAPKVIQLDGNIIPFEMTRDDDAISEDHTWLFSENINLAAGQVLSVNLAPIHAVKKSLSAV